MKVAPTATSDTVCDDLQMCNYRTEEIVDAEVDEDTLSQDVYSADRTCTARSVCNADFENTVRTREKKRTIRAHPTRTAAAHNKVPQYHGYVDRCRSLCVNLEIGTPGGRACSGRKRTDGHEQHNACKYTRHDPASILRLCCLTRFVKE